MATDATRAAVGIMGLAGTFGSVKSDLEMACTAVGIGIVGGRAVGAETGAGVAMTELAGSEYGGGAGFLVAAAAAAAAAGAAGGGGADLRMASSFLRLAFFTVSVRALAK